MTKITLAKGLNMGLRKAMEDDPSSSWARTSASSAASSASPTASRRTSARTAGHRLPAGRVRHRRDRRGLRLRGYRPVVEIQFDGFVYPVRPDRLPGRQDAVPPAGQARRCRWSSGSRSAAASARSSTTASRRRRSSRTRPASRWSPAPTRIDGYWMIQQAIASDDPVIFLEPKRQYHADKADLDETATPGPLFAPARRPPRHRRHAAGVRPDGEDGLKAAEAAAGEGRSLEVIDLRTLSPLDMAPVYGSVRRTGHAVVVHEAHVNLGLGSELAARITEECFYSLEAPVLRVGGFDTPYPPSRIEEEWLPDLDRVLDAVDRSLAFYRREPRCLSTSCPTSARASPRPRS